MNHQTLVKEPILPKALKLDYSNAEELYAYYMLLGKTYERNGGLNSPKTYKLQSIDQEARYWLKGMEEYLLDGPIADVPLLLEAYDFIYRVCYRKVPTSFCNDIRIKTVQKWLKGDKSLNYTGILQVLWPMMMANFRNVDQRYRDFYISIIDSWITELMAFGKFRGISDIEAYQRLTILLQEDLYEYLAGMEKKKGDTKKKWVAIYKADDFRQLNTPALRAYIPFIRIAAIYGYHPCEDSDALYVALITELETRPDLHPYYREAIRLDLANKDNRY